MKNEITMWKTRMTILTALCMAAAILFCAAPATAHAATALKAGKTISAETTPGNVQTYTFYAPKSGYSYLTLTPDKVYTTDGELSDDS